MDTEQLKTFLEVSRTRHFGRAARNLFLSQSAVSSRIKALEEQLGTALFIRNRHDIQLTSTGSRLLDHAENILSSWSRAKHDIALEDDKSSSLAVAGTPSLWDIALQDWLHQMNRQHADIAIHAEVLDTETMVRRLMERTLDLGFTFEPPQIAQLETKQFANIPLVMVSSKMTTLAAEAIADGYVMVDWGLAYAVNHARYFPEANAPVIRLPLGRIALDYILACGGAAYLAEPMVVSAIENGQLYKVEDAPIIERPAFALFASNSDRSESVDKALNIF